MRPLRLDPGQAASEEKAEAFGDALAKARWLAAGAGAFPGYEVLRTVDDPMAAVRPYPIRWQLS